ncbi:MAG: DNA repair protein RadA, partial [Clostridia bacterium]|nr:DNA repair protein RadA [Clostridia bacterium]
MKGLKTVYICSECEYESPKWLGKCPKCNAWNSFVEDVEQIAQTSTQKRTSVIHAGESRAEQFSDLEAPSYIRSATGLSELDRVLGGG